MSFVPPDFGGFVSAWDSGNERAVVVRYGQGRPLEGMRLTALNLLQLRAQLDLLIEQGEHDGHVRPEHHEQAAKLRPVQTSAEDFERNVPPRSTVDDIAGTE